VFRSQLLSQPTISWVAFGWPDGSFFAGHKLGDGVIEMLEITPDRKMRISRYEFVGNDLRLKSTRVEDTNYSVTDQEWFQVAIETNDEHWATLTTHPSGERLAAAFAAPISIDQKPAGVIAIIIELTRVSNFLSQLTVGKSAGAFILERNGRSSPHRSNANEVMALSRHPLFPSQWTRSASAYNPVRRAVSHQVTRDGRRIRRC
jgi:adenylate cyclase